MATLTREPHLYVVSRRRALGSSVDNVWAIGAHPKVKPAPNETIIATMADLASYDGLGMVPRPPIVISAET